MRANGATTRQCLRGKVAVVTGGAGGIGSAVCARFAREGAAVYSADLAPGASVSGVDYVRHDVTDEQSAVDVMERVRAAHAKLDILVNAAGIEIETTIEDTSLAEWNRVFAVNVTGMFLTSKHALPLLRAAGKGSIINFGSYDGFIADPSLAAYCASKGAVHALTRAMACDYGAEGIRVNAVCPGYVNTPMLQKFFGEAADPEAVRREARNIHPLRMIGEPKHIANMVCWLAGDEAEYASGQLWIVDGGLSAQVQQMRL